MKQSQFYYLLRRGLFSAGSAIIKNGLVMFNKFTTAGLNFPAQGSAEFNGSSDYIQLDNAFSHTNHTIAAWVYANNTSAYKSIFTAWDTLSDGIRFALRDDEIVIYTINGTNVLAFGLNVNKWSYVVASYDGSTMKLFIDGSQISTNSISTTISNSTNATIASRSDNYGDKFNGNLANVAIWNRALSSDEINSVMWKSYEALSGAESNGLQAWYSLDNIDGTNVPDSSGNGNDGTAN